MDWMKVLPQCENEDVDFDQAREIRLRPFYPLYAQFPWGKWQGAHPLSPAEIETAAQALSGYALAAHGEQLAQGFLPLPGGHRLGIAGEMGPCGIRKIHSLCLRIAHEVKGCGQGIFSALQGKHTLIIGPPGSGKTTLLRDLARLHALAGWQVGIADERGEIAACREGMPQLDVGPLADVVSGMEKEKSLMMLIRAMAPQILITDELGGKADGRAVMEAIRCGVILLCTAHGRNIRDIACRPGIGAIVDRGIFEKTVLLSQVGEQPQVEDL